MKKRLPVAGSIFLLFLSLFLFSFGGASEAGVTSAQRPSEQRSPLFAQQFGVGGVISPPSQPPSQPPGITLDDKGVPMPALPDAAPEKPLPSEAVQDATKQPPNGRLPAAAPMPSVIRAAGGPVSFFFDDADIFEVVQTVFGDILRVNYLIDQRVKGKVTFRTVTPIPREEVLPVMETILRINGIGFVEEKGLYRIVPLTDVSKELVYSQVGKDPGKVAIEMFTFKNMNLKEAMADIESAIGLNVQGGTIRILPIWRLNALLAITSTREQMDYLRQWITAFDGMFAEARPKVMVYPLQNSKAAHVASMLQAILGGAAAAAPAATAPKAPAAGAPAAAPPAPKPGPAAVAAGTGFLVSAETRIFADEITNALIILATPADYAFIEETIKKIDVLSRQVVIEGLIVRVDLTDNLSFGVSWSLNTDVNIKGIEPFKRDINLAGDVTVLPFGATLDKTPGTGFTFVGTDPKGIVRARINAALKDSRAKILAAPHILVLDNREARIQVGSQVPLATQTTTSPLTGGVALASAVTSTIQYKDIGIILKVKPQVNDSGLVSLDISQEVSSLGENVRIADQQFASINKTEATTNLVAQDGETIIIGGLIREDTSKVKDGIPLLSQIPILGSLFSNTTDSSTRSELIILLTPHVIKNMQEAEKVTQEYVDRYKGATKDKQIDEFIKERGQQGKDSGDAGAKDSRQDSP